MRLNWTSPWREIGPKEKLTGGGAALEREIFAQHGLMAGKHVIYGINAVATLLRRSPERAEIVYLQRDLGTKRLARLSEPLERSGVGVRRVAASELENLTQSDKHQGVAALTVDSVRLQEVEAKRLIQGLDRALILVFDGIQDPRNFGACLRSANAAGVDLVATPRSRTVSYTPVVSKVAAGAAEAQPVVEVANLVRFLDYLQDQGICLIGAAADAPATLFDVELTGPLAVVLGAEGKGLRRLTRERCDYLVSLPMSGVVDSLNISVATGICLYECLRQRTLAVDPAVR
jgi:23S rRNA (guanosine2251-2'-O)-methyltransferase